MENKKRDFLIMIIAAVILAFVNIAVYYNDLKLSASGMAISDSLGIVAKPGFSQAAFIIQWVLILNIIIFALVKYAKSNKEEDLSINYDSIKIKLGKSDTDIDLLYSVLKNEKKLKLAAISKIFNISKDKALEWGKILENYNLASLNYPAFSEPILEILER